ncbi:MAG: hypothetical protein QME63_02140 [Actinomycetota bacterium]|nr:hypothetical protein [Actinomycetota bacterium]
MSAEHELTESWKLIPELQQQVALQGKTIEEQVTWLNSKINKLINRNKNGWEYNRKMEALAGLSLLSEMYAILDFDKMVEVREKFQSLFPDHFSAYLGRLESLSWQIFWPGCLECRYFEKRCSLGISPTILSGGWRSSERMCRSKEKRTEKT